MILTTSKTIFAIEKIMGILKVIFELTKFRLSFLVSFSAIFGFILASDNFYIIDLMLLLRLNSKPKISLAQAETW